MKNVFLVGFLVLVFVSATIMGASASQSTVTRLTTQTKYGALNYLYFETVSGPGSSSPSANTAFIPSGTSNSYSISRSSTGYLWSTQFGTATTLSAGKWFLGIWAASTSYIIGYVPITLTNSQASPTPNPFQAKIAWNPSSYASYEASDLGNIRFYLDSALTNPAYAWLESCTPSLNNTATSAVAWIKLTSAISANGGQLVIYMAFLSTSTTFDAIYWGDAPNLSSTYGANDSGVNVFGVYDNFKGPLNSTKWTTVKTSSATVTASSGLSVTTTSSSAYGFIASSTQQFPMVAEAYLASSSSGVTPLLGVSTTTSPNDWIALYNGYSIDEILSSHNYVELAKEPATGSAQLTKSSISAFSYGIWQVTWSATGSESVSDGNRTLTSTDSSLSIGNYRIYLGQSNYGTGTNVFRWARMRAYPPSGIMPTVAIGSLTVPTYAVNVSIFVTDATGNIQSTIANNVQSPAIATSKTMYTMSFTGAQVNVPQNGYLEFTLSATSSSSYTIYWGTGQQTNFQVPYRVLT